MDLVPLRIRKYEMNEGKVIILVPKFQSRFYHFIAPSSAKLFFRIKLDDMGTITWDGIDGIRNVQEICNYIKKNKPDGDISGLDERVSKYMMMLYERRFISFKQILNN